ncbi:sorting nexin-21 [Atheta coriaria]|uniref:sorting nexin-21 n=1 Tax=Dalotia coriaria TaxID=877792 RepID=UPI0031F36F42
MEPNEPVQKSRLFQVISAHFCDEDTKRYVVYTLKVCHVTRMKMGVSIERRYTHFLNLYNGLIEEYADLMAPVVFPKKALTGNFDDKLIRTRSIAFETLMQHIMGEERLRSSKSLLEFLQEPEMTTAKQLIEQKDYPAAIPILENTFRILNNIYTDRSPQVLLVLCRLLSCSFNILGAPNTLKWADLALHRFEGVSDSDLLLLYVPILFMCKKIWVLNGRDKAGIEQRLEDLKRQGMTCTDNVTLMDTIFKVELILTGTPT